MSQPVSRRFILGSVASASLIALHPCGAFAQQASSGAEANMVGSTPLPAASKSVEMARWLGRISYGADTSSLAQAMKLDKRAFLDAQLALPPADPPQVAQKIASLDVSRNDLLQTYADLIADTLEVRAAAKQGPDQKKEAYRTLGDQGRTLSAQVRERHLLRALYSQGQLREVMTWFWMNHFSVYERKRDIRWTVGYMENDSVRPRVFGKFKDLLMATVISPAMLRYLDNTLSRADKLNENYARELMELHTMGVSGGASGSNYTQQDVQELARVLTGLGVAKPDNKQVRKPKAKPPGYQRFGIVEFDPAKHDKGSKTVLGQRIEPGGFAEIERAVTLLCKQDATARYISGKLTNFFFGDHPPAAVLDAASAEFKRSDGDISAVLRVILLSAQLEERLAKGPMEFKDPQQFVVSSLRLFKDGQPVITDMSQTNAWLDQLGGALYGRITPDGYPMDDESWSNSGQMVKRFEVAQGIAAGRAPLHVRSNAEKRLSRGASAASAHMPKGKSKDDQGARGQAGGRAVPPKLDADFYATVIAPQLSERTKATMAKASGAVERNALLLSSPEWMQR